MFLPEKITFCVLNADVGTDTLISPYLKSEKISVFNFVTRKTGITNNNDESETDHRFFHPDKQFFKIFCAIFQFF
jgi:hypothetical protein